MQSVIVAAVVAMRTAAKARKKRPGIEPGREKRTEVTAGHIAALNQAMTGF